MSYSKVKFTRCDEIQENEVQGLIANKILRPPNTRPHKTLTTKQILKTSWVELGQQSSLKAKSNAEKLALELDLPIGITTDRYQVAMLARVEDLEITLDSGAGRHLISLRDARLLNADIVTAKELGKFSYC